MLRGRSVAGLLVWLALACGSAESKEPGVQFTPATDVAVFRGTVRDLGNKQAIAAVAAFAKQHGFRRDGGSLDDSPDFPKGDSPVVMVSNTHDGNLTVALVKDRVDKATYVDLVQDLTGRMLPLGFHAVTRPAIVIENGND